MYVFNNSALIYFMSKLKIFFLHTKYFILGNAAVVPDGRCSVCSHTLFPVWPELSSRANFFYLEYHSQDFYVAETPLFKKGEHGTFLEW